MSSAPKAGVPDSIIKAAMVLTEFGSGLIPATLVHKAKSIVRQSGSGQICDAVDAVRYSVGS